MTPDRRHGAKRFAPRPNHRSPPNPNRRRPDQGGNAKASYERYVALARASALTGDTVATENYYQHAEHYFRVMNERSE